jgi:putative addiction module component (TIGR02574 family)
MTKRLEIPPAGFNDLSVDEQIEYVQDLWDRIAARPEDIPVAD